MSGTDKDVYYIHFDVGRIGFLGLPDVFDEASGRAFENDEALKRFLLEGAKRRNYVPPSCEKEYEEHLLREYRRFRGDVTVDEITGKTLEVKILGAGCTNCERLKQETIDALQELELQGDVEHVQEAARIGEFGVTATPALVINGKVVSVGRVLMKREIMELLGKIEEARSNEQ